VEAALARYEAERRPDVERIQGAARPSLSWWENFGRYHDAFEPTQFVFHFLSRSIPRAKLRLRDPGFVGAVDAWWADRHGAPPLDTPLDVAGRRLTGRRVDLSAAADGSWTLVRDAVELRVATPAQVGPGTAVRLTAPADEEGLAASRADLDRAVAAGAVLAVVTGGTPLTRVLLAEEARLVRGLPVALVQDVDDDAAETLVLSGRTDLVATERPA
jgi:anthraniloyl-CoA monooxygenase